jgi:hypothetical protein
MLQFPYQDEPLRGQPPPSLPASATVRWRPLVPVTAIGPTAKRRFFPRALLDPGADDTVFPLALAAMLDVTLRADLGHGLRWRGQGYALRFADLDLELCDGPRVWRWPAIVGFSPAPLRYPTLGICGCLQFFDTRFCGATQIVEVETNASFPGTTT